MAPSFNMLARISDQRLLGVTLCCVSAVIGDSQMCGRCWDGSCSPYAQSCDILPGKALITSGPSVAGRLNSAKFDSMSSLSPTDCDHEEDQEIEGSCRKSAESLVRFQFTELNSKKQGEEIQA